MMMLVLVGSIKRGWLENSALNGGFNGKIILAMFYYHRVCSLSFNNGKIEV
jgi:hypothetical protein